MATAPTVQSLDNIMSSLQPGYTAQTDVLNKQIADTDASYEANRLALDAAKTKGFNQINNQAAARGMAFSGIPLSEQADYLSNTYLPGLQQAKADQQNTKNTLAGQIAALQSEQRNNALNVQQQQQSALDTWNLTQSKLQAQAEQNRLDREASAREAAANRQLTRAQYDRENTTPTPIQYIANKFASLGSDPNWRNNGATESSGLMGDLVANYGYSPEDARRMVYAWRKKYYGF